jgi:hypothetical protein
MQDRQVPDASLSPGDLMSLHRIAYGLGSAVSHGHGATLIRSELAYLDGICTLALTEMPIQGVVSVAARSYDILCLVSLHSHPDRSRDKARAFFMA